MDEDQASILSSPSQLGAAARAQTIPDLQPEPLEAPADTQQRVVRTQIIKAKNLADAGLPSWQDGNGLVQPVTDSNGAPLTHYDKSHGIAYDSAGNPNKVNYDGNGAPVLSDPLADAPIVSKKNPDTGLYDRYKTPAGLPWKYVEPDEVKNAKLAAAESQKATNAAATALGRQLSSDEGEIVRGNSFIRASKKRLLKDVPIDPTLLGEDPKTVEGDPSAVHAAIDQHFDEQYALPENNEKGSWLGDDLSDTAKAARAKLDQQKAQAHARADQLFSTQDAVAQKTTLREQRMQVEQQLRTQQLREAAQRAGLMIPGLEDSEEPDQTNQQNSPDTGKTSPSENTPDTQGLPSTVASQGASPTSTPPAEASPAIPGMEPEGALASGMRAALTGVVPAIGAALGGRVGTVASGLAGAESGPADIPIAIAGGLIAAGAGAALGKKAQDHLMGGEWTAHNQAQLDANMAAHPIASKIGAFIPAVVSMIGGAGPQIEKAAAGYLERIAQSGATPTFIQKAIAALPENMVIGARMGTAASSENLADGKGSATDLINEAVKGAVTMGPVAFVPGASTLLGAAMGKAPADAAVLATSNALYDRTVKGTPIDFDKLKEDIGTDIPGFVLLNIFSSLTHGHPIFKPSASEGGTPPEPTAPSSPPSEPAAPSTPTTVQPQATPDKMAEPISTEAAITTPATPEKTTASVEPSHETPAPAPEIPPVEPPQTAEQTAPAGAQAGREVPAGMTNLGDALERAQKPSVETAATPLVSPSTTEPTTPAGSAPPIAGPALADASGKIISRGEIGQTHADLKSAAIKGGNVEAADAQHVFHVAGSDNPLNREEAARHALATGQIDQPTFNKTMARREPGLESQDLKPSISQTHAVQKPSTGTILQREPGQASEGGGQRRGVEQVQQGAETSETSQAAQHAGSAEVGPRVPGLESTVEEKQPVPKASEKKGVSAEEGRAAPTVPGLEKPKAKSVVKPKSEAPQIPGEMPVEPPKAAVEHVKIAMESAQTDPSKPTPKATRDEALEQLRKELEKAPPEESVPGLHHGGALNAEGSRLTKENADKAGTITIDIPGDGKFTIIRTKEAITEAINRLSKLSAQPKFGAPTDGPGVGRTEPQMQAAQMVKGMGKKKAIAELERQRAQLTSKSAQAMMDKTIESAKAISEPDESKSKVELTDDPKSISDTAPAKGILSHHVQVVADRLGDKFDGAARTIVVPDGSYLLDAVKDAAKSKGITDLNRIGGVFHDGVVYLNSAGIESPKRAAEIWFHEQAGHVGVSKLLEGISRGSEQTLADTLRGSFPADWEHVAARYNPSEHVDETLARIMERVGTMDAPERNLWRKVVDFIRTTLAKAGLKQWSEEDVQALLRRGLDRIREPEVHHSEFQDRAEDGRFNGPPKFNAAEKAGPWERAARKISESNKKDVAFSVEDSKDSPNERPLQNPPLDTISGLRGVGGGLLEAATAHVRANGRAIAEKSGTAIEDGEREALTEWAVRNKRVFPQKRFIGRRSDDGGIEHEVFFKEWPGRVAKVYKDKPLDVPYYLERMVLQNQLFGDDIELEGVTFHHSGKMAAVISQPFREGMHPTSKEIDTFMAEKGYQKVHPDSVGAWMGNGVHVTDGGPKNWIKSSDGKLMPIDLHIAPSDSAPKFSIEGEDATSTKREWMRAAREARGASEIATIDKPKREELIAKARTELERNPDAARELVREINDNEGPLKISSQEEAILAASRRMLETQRNEAISRSMDESATPQARVVADERFKALDSEIDDLDHATNKTGASWSNWGRFRMQELKKDFSFAQIEKRIRAAMGDREVKPADVQQWQKWADDIKAATDAKIKRMEEMHAEERTSAVNAAVEQAKSDWAKNQPDPRISAHSAEVVGRIKERLAPSLDKARAFFNASKGTGTKFSIEEPAKPEWFQSVAEHGAAKLAERRLSKEEWFDALKKDIGDVKGETNASRDALWKESNAILDREIEADKKKNPSKPVKKDTSKDEIVQIMQEKIGEGEDVSDLGRFVKKLAERLVGEGIDQREPLVDALHAEMRKVVPNIDRETVQDLFSDYGQFSPATTEALKVKVAQLRGEVQQSRKIIDMLKGLPAQLTGKGRVPQSDEHRALTKQVEDLKRRGGFKVADPARQLKTALDAIKTRLRNEIADMDLAISTRKPMEGKKHNVTFDAETTALKVQRDAKKAEYEQQFPKDEKQARLDAVNHALERAIADLESQLKAGKLYPDQPGPKLTSPEIEAKRARLDALRDERNVLRGLDSAKVEAEQAKAVSERIAELEKERASGWPESEATGRPTADTAELAKLKAERDALLKERSKAQNPPKDEETKRLDALERAIAAKEAKITAGDISSPAKNQNVKTPEVSAKEAKLHELNAELSDLRKKSETRWLEQRKALKSRQLAYSLEKLASGDIHPKPKTSAQFKPDKELRDLTIAESKVKQQIADRIYQEQHKNRNVFQKITGWVAALNRANVLSGIATLEKLTGAGLENVVSRPITSLVAQGMRAHPTLDAIRRKAVYEGTISTKSELAGVRGLINSFRGGRTSAVFEKLKNGESGIDYENATDKWRVKEFGRIIGQIHGAIKEPVRQGIYARSVELGIKHFEDQGIDPRKDEVLLRAIQKQAYDNANMDIFMGDNFLTKTIHGAINGILRGNKSDPGVAKFAADVFDILFPILNVPTNIAIRKFRLLTGLGEGAGRLLYHGLRGDLANGAEKLTSRDAEIITRALKYGAFGLAMSVYAWQNPQRFGGIWAIGKQAPHPHDLPPGDIKLPNGQVLSHHLAHGPMGGHLNMVADARRLYDKLKKEGPKTPWSNMTETAFFSMFAGAKDLAVISTPARWASPFKSAGAKAGEIVKSIFIPRAVQDFAKWQDGKERKATTFSGELKSAIPGLRQSLPVRKDNHQTAKEPRSLMGLPI